MTRSELIDLMAEGQSQLSAKDVELAVKLLIDHMAETLSSGQRIEIRGFGSFSLHYREPRLGRNPRTGDAVDLRGKHVPHFKPGKELRERVNASLQSSGSSEAGEGQIRDPGQASLAAPSGGLNAGLNDKAR